MIALKANYANGHINFLDPMPDRIKRAKLTIVIENIDEAEETADSTTSVLVKENDSESEFKLIGLTDFFEVENDKNINWEEYFGIK